LSNMHLVHTLPPYLSVVHFNIIHPFTAVFMVVSFLQIFVLKLYMQSVGKCLYKNATVLFSGLLLSSVADPKEDPPPSRKCSVGSLLPT
jgi:hypothetical protein